MIKILLISILAQFLMAKEYSPVCQRIEDLIALKSDKKKMHNFFYLGEAMKVAKPETCFQLSGRKFKFLIHDERKKIHRGEIEFKLKCSNSDKLDHFIKFNLDGGSASEFSGVVENIEGTLGIIKFASDKFKIQIWYNIVQPEIPAMDIWQFTM